MKIIILGAGQVGGTLAENLSNYNNDITIVDINSYKLKQLQEKYDLKTIKGHASYPNVLKDAQAEDADMLIAVTYSDEINILACHIAYTLFKTPNRIARIRSSDYIQESCKLFSPASIPIDHVISPEMTIANNICNLIEYPGALQITIFSNKNINLLAIKLDDPEIKLIENIISMFPDSVIESGMKIAAVYRNKKFILPELSTELQTGDEIFFITISQNIKLIVNELQKYEKPYKRIMIVGGGNIGAMLADKLDKNYQVKLIEIDQKRASELAKKLKNTTVFYGDASNEELLMQENIEQVEVFISITNDDEVNIMSAMLAKKMGAKKVLVLIQRRAYADLMQKSIIDISISPQESTISDFFKYLKNKSIVNIFSIRHGLAEVVEAVTRGDESTSQVIGKSLYEIKFPPGTIIGAIIRNSEIISEKNYNPVQQNDHFIIFLTDKKFIKDIELLFEPNPFFL
ncbi:trkA [Wigglesworthia glossinidia endosymbiont of Glossina brevipalpis]|uniref:Trk system potassium uptake protein TrkA n=1 Tax=Wigglesworthia glossinidia brevipalpis TaxID=36870 RepID=Q8D260_WIGBR|nr:trkA [Wigglesworthia glossinidia endosymbiont of Glossina brevipalpis]